MSFPILLEWVDQNLLGIVVGGITLFFLYYYFIEKEKGVKLSKRYRDSLFEVQSKIFLNATQYLISGNKDLAIKEFLNAVDLNKDTIDTYFALARLFRSNGEIEKAVGIHRSLIARDNISESTRVEALKELGMDFDKGGFLEKAIETYRDVLKINKEQVDVIRSLCRIYEDLEDWDEALKHRLMLSKYSQENQADTISHIYIELAKKHMEKGEYSLCWERLEEAFRFSPSISAKILQLKYYLITGRMEDAKSLLNEIVNEHEMYINFMFVTLEDFKGKTEAEAALYFERFGVLKEQFLDMQTGELGSKPTVFLSRVRLLVEKGKMEEAYEFYRKWLEENPTQSEILKIEYIKLLVRLGKKEEALEVTGDLVEGLQRSSTRHYCTNCGYNSDDVFWRCPQCFEWETINFRLKI